MSDVIKDDAYWRIFGFYESGKARRYGHLFAVNGGAYALVGFLLDRFKTGESHNLMVISWAFLAIPVLMFIFSWAMCVDIDTFGKNMREDAGYKRDENLDKGIYGKAGRDLQLIVRWIFALGWIVALMAGLSILLQRA